MKTKRFLYAKEEIKDMPRKKYSAKFKSHVALEAIREQRTLAELSKEYEVSVNQISLWKQEAIRDMDMLFGGDRSSREIKEKDSQIRDFRTKVGELTMERDFFEQACKMMGLEAIYPRKSLSKPGNTIHKAPYLLRGEPVMRFNHVWSMDISYIAMKEGFM